MTSTPKKTTSTSGPTGPQDIDGIETGTESALAGPDTPDDAREGLPAGEQSEPRPDDLPAEQRMTPLAQQVNNLAGPAVGEIKPEGATAEDYSDNASDGPAVVTGEPSVAPPASKK